MGTRLERLSGARVTSGWGVLIALTLIGATLVGSPALAESSTPRLSVPENARTSLAKAERMGAQAAALREVAGSGTVSAALQATLAVESGSVASPPAVHPLGATPSTLGQFMAATNELARTLQGIVRTMDRVTQRDIRILEHGGLVTRTQTEREVTRVASVRAITTREIAGTGSAGHPVAPPGLTAKAAGVASAVDRYIATVRPFADAQGSRTGSSPGCDLADQRPLLCVSGAGDNVHGGPDAMLSVDLGGHDKFTNGAGAAPFQVPGQNQMIPLAVSISLDGQDTYAAEGYSPGFDHHLVTQGAAYGRGIGILVNLGGNNTYSAHQPAAKQVDPSLIIASTGDIWAQGASYVGVGLLVNNGGGNTYKVSREDGPDGAGWITGQGITNFGVAGLVNVGGGNTYEIAAGSSHDTGCREVFGQGFGGAGPALLADIGTTGSSFRMTAGSTSSATSAGPHISACPSLVPGAAVLGQGFATAGGTGTLLSGTGNDVFLLRNRASGPTHFQFAQGQGAVDGGGVATLDDAGGANAFTVSATNLAEVDLCGCGQKDLSAQFEQASRPIVIAQGAANLGAGWLLVHGDGADTYEAEASIDLSVGVNDSQSPPAGAGLRVVGYERPTLMAQGGGQNPQVALLLDEGGDDSYRATVRSQVHATTTPEDDARTISAIAMNSGGNLVWTQGANGQLWDLGGSDSFTAERSVSSSGSTDGLSYAWDAEPSAWQGDDVGALIALGDQPLVGSSPANIRCATAPTGVAATGGCGSDQASPDGLQFLPGTAPVVPTTLTVNPPDGNDGAATITGRLTSTSPIAPGLPLHVALVASTPVERVSGVPETATPVHDDLWRVDTTTAADGSFEATLPLALTLPYGIDLHDAGLQYQVRVVFDGARLGPSDLAPTQVWSAPIAIQGA